MTKTTKLTMMAAVCLAAVGARAATVTLTVDPNVTSPGTVPFVLGDVNPGLPADDASKAAMINNMITLALGGHDIVTIGPQVNDVYRSLNPFSLLPTVTANDVATQTQDGGNVTTIADNGFYYLAAKYDGPNGATEVWDIGSLPTGTTIIIPENAFGLNNNQYGLSGWALMDYTPDNPNLPPQGGPVPDGGSTLALLGFAIVGVETLRRKICKS
jgi:hypothetical protein